MSCQPISTSADPSGHTLSKRFHEGGYCNLAKPNTDMTGYVYKHSIHNHEERHIDKHEDMTSRHDDTSGLRNSASTLGTQVLPKLLEVNPLHDALPWHFFFLDALPM